MPRTKRLKWAVWGGAATLVDSLRQIPGKDPHFINDELVDAVKKCLTTTGPYSFMRNPIYIANTCLMIGACAMSELMWLLPFVFLWCVLVYNLVVRYEELHLQRKYGRPYLEYTRQVPRWFPCSLRSTGPVPTRQFLAVSIRAELFCLLYILPFILKELLY